MEMFLTMNKKDYISLKEVAAFTEWLGNNFDFIGGKWVRKKTSVHYSFTDLYDAFRAEMFSNVRYVVRVITWDGISYYRPATPAEIFENLKSGVAHTDGNDIVFDFRDEEK